MQCPLCSFSGQNQKLTGPLKRTFYSCKNCGGIFVDHNEQIAADEEKDRYKEHNNSINDKGYIQFLNNAVNPALPYLTANMKGLDYGSGPSPVLTELLKQKGIDCTPYDPFFTKPLPDELFDFIFSTETFEHFYHPARELEKIVSRLKPGGFLIVMTKSADGVKPADFTNWHYARDITHVFFYTDKSFRYIENIFGLKRIEFTNERVFIFQKK